MRPGLVRRLGGRSGLRRATGHDDGRTDRMSVGIRQGSCTESRRGVCTLGSRTRYSASLATAPEALWGSSHLPCTARLVSVIQSLRSLADKAKLALGSRGLGRMQEKVEGGEVLNRVFRSLV